jgi:protein-L-isoaspartate(D-aspartate) O-methyltransferase
MVEEQLVARNIRSARVLEAMREVPRHLFVPGEDRARAYADTALSIGHGQTISQPYMVALMLEALELKGSERALDVGAGSGRDNVAAMSCWWSFSMAARSASRPLSRPTDAAGF